jgi:hypothetical protein
MALSHGTLVPSDSVGTVHSVYRRTVNLKVNRGAVALARDTGSTCPFLVSLVTADVGDQACAVRLRQLPDVRPGMPFLIKEGTLHLDDSTIQLDDGTRWRATPPRELGLALCEVAPGLAQRLGVVRRAAEPRCAEDITALAPFTDPDRYSRSWVRRLVGLGPGLTPSGDDVLLGAMLAHQLAASARWPGADRELSARVRGEIGRTGDVSAHLLRLAVHGYFSAPLLGLAAALVHHPRGLAAALGAALSVGASSGADAAYGLAVSLADLLAEARLNA